MYYTSLCFCLVSVAGMMERQFLFSPPHPPCSFAFLPPPLSLPPCSLQLRKTHLLPKFHPPANRYHQEVNKVVVKATGTGVYLTTILQRSPRRWLHPLARPLSALDLRTCLSQSGVSIMTCIIIYPNNEQYYNIHLCILL